jgi:hypothetical protein
MGLHGSRRRDATVRASLAEGSMRPFDRLHVKPGDLLTMKHAPDVRMRFKFFGHDGCVIADLEPDSWPERTARSVITQQRTCLMVDDEAGT